MNVIENHLTRDVELITENDMDCTFYYRWNSNVCYSASKKGLKNKDWKLILGCEGVVQRLSAFHKVSIRNSSILMDEVDIEMDKELFYFMCRYFGIVRVMDSRNRLVYTVKPPIQQSSNETSLIGDEDVFEKDI